MSSTLSQNKFPMSPEHLVCERMFMESKISRSSYSFDSLLHSNKGKHLPFDYFVNKLTAKK